MNNEQEDYRKKYCKQFDSSNVGCISCIDMAVFKVKPCYKAGKER